MRARRLRGSIRTAQGKMGAMREGFASFREEIVKMRDLYLRGTDRAAEPPRAHGRLRLRLGVDGARFRVSLGIGD